jgi:hypothetical protein
MQNDQVMNMINTLKKIALVALIGFTLTIPSLAAADCFVDYKAKHSSSGLKLHYGVMKLSSNPCSDNTSAQQVVSKRLASGGWTLLTVISMFDQSGLTQRQANAGAYFLKY